MNTDNSKKLWIYIMVMVILACFTTAALAINPQPEPPGSLSANSVLKKAKLVKPGSNLTLRPKIVNKASLANFAKAYDSNLIKLNKSRVKPLSAQQIPTYMPAKLDFTKYITFTGNQDGWGGCIGRSMVHVMNIQNEREHPYTPDLSMWYIHARQMQLWPGDIPDTKFILENEGLCSEALLPTDYDKVKKIDGKLDFSDMTWPSASNYLEAKAFYRVKLHDPVTPSVDNAKALMLKYGPILAEGPMYIVQGDNPSEGHCVTIVGYDNNTQQFQLLNSWGDQKHGGDGIFEIPYDQFTKNVTSLEYIEDLPSPRHLTNYAYSARIKLKGNYAYRNKLTVKIGVEGQQPLVVWDTPNQSVCYDNSKDLCIDVPLPTYAASYWPPKGTARWYVEVKNDNWTYYPDKPDDLDNTYTLEEFTLARLYKNSNGKFATQTYQAKAGTIIGSKTVKVYIPAKKTQTYNADAKKFIKK